jgi:predicted Zn-dependent peptidase
MIKEKFFIEQFDNGLTLLAEQLDYVVSAAIAIAVPAGCSRDGAQLAGASTVMTEWLFRGAGGRNSRQLNDALDSLGCHREETVRSLFVHFGASQTHQSLNEVLGLYGDILARPELDDKTFDPCRNLVAQELSGLEDDPSRKCNLCLRERFYPKPLGSPVLGTPQSLQAMTSQALRDHARSHLTPSGTMLAVAGRFDWPALRDHVAGIFSSWRGQPREELSLEKAQRGVCQEPKATAQVQICLAYDAPLPQQEKLYYPMRVAEMVLSGGMSGRLFTEVREKRGLVYSVGARYHGMKAAAGMFIYAGTSPERAQQTLDVTVGELKRLGEGIDEDELVRAKTQLKSALVMQGESTAARANGLVGDWHLLGRLRGLEEVSGEIDAVTRQDVLECLAAYPAKALTGCFLGPAPLDTAALL